MQERSSCSVQSASHQFCTLWLQLTPSTWHAGCRIVQRPAFGGLLKSSRDYGIGFFMPAPLARTICWPWAQKIRQQADSRRPQPSWAQLRHFVAAIRPKRPPTISSEQSLGKRRSLVMDSDSSDSEGGLETLALLVLAGFEGEVLD